MDPLRKLFVFVIVFLSSSCLAYEAYVEDGLERMNLYRERHHSPPLEIDDDLMDKAMKCAEYYAEKGEMDHSCPYKENYGEDLGWESSSEGPPSKRLTTVKSIDDWYREYKDYNFEDPSVETGEVTGHFTQLLWKATEKTGIAAVQDDEKKTTYVVALFDPAGNVKVKSGDRFKYFKENVLLP